MAKFEKSFQGDFDHALSLLHQAVMDGSTTASLEDGSDFRCGDARCAVRVYERYSYFGGNRVSLSVTLVGRGGGAVSLRHHLRGQSGHVLQGQHLGRGVLFGRP